MRSRWLGWIVPVQRGIYTPLAFLAVSCSLTLPDEVAPIHDGASCSEWTLSDALRAARRADRRTPTQELECILMVLRQEWLQGPQHGSLACRTCFLLADIEADPERRRLLASEGVRWAEIAQSLGAWSDAATLYYHAMNLGLAVRDNVVLALKNLTRIEALLTRAAVLDPGLDQGGPVRVLGMLYVQAPAWPQGLGDPDRGLNLLRWAAHHYPGHPLNLLLLGRALWEVEGEGALDRVARSLCRAIRLARSREWGRAGEEWLSQARDLANEAGVRCR